MKNEKARTHWCISNKHKKCSGQVSEIERNGLKLEDLKEDNFNYYKCRCVCHYGLK